MLGMTDEIRQAIRVQLAVRDEKQVDLADKLGVSKQYLNSVLRGRTAKLPPIWERIFAELDLELTVNTKQGN